MKKEGRKICENNLEHQEMRPLKRASGVLKDQKSLLFSSISRKTTFRNPDIEIAIIKATNHDEFRIDYKNFHRVLAWLRLSDVHVKPAVHCISSRLQKTCSWVVAIKGLMLMHGVVSTRIAVVQLVGRLPFDLSNFKDGYSKLRKTWAHNAFIRSYYAFLDYKLVLLYTNLRENVNSTSSQYRMSISQSTNINKDIIILQKVQGLLDLLLQIKPLSSTANVFLIVESMDRIVMESFDIYTRFCKMIANVISRIKTFSKGEAGKILTILQKAVDQGHELSLYFEFCRQIGVEGALEIPNPPKIPDEDIQLLKQMAHGVPKVPRIIPRIAPRRQEEKKAIVQIHHQTQKRDQRDDDPRYKFKTIITNDWEKFDEDNLMLATVEPSSVAALKQSASATEYNPFYNLSAPPYVSHHTEKGQQFPDLINFL